VTEETVNDVENYYKRNPNFSIEKQLKYLKSLYGDIYLKENCYFENKEETGWNYLKNCIINV
jgi:hypothetical protein